MSQRASLASLAGWCRVLAAVSCGLPACNGDGKDSALGSGDCPASNTVALADTNNYQLTSTLDIRSTDIRAYDEANPTDYRIDWSGVARDLQGHAMSATDDVDLVGMVQFPTLSEAEVAAQIADESLLQEDVGGTVSEVVSGVDETTVSNLTLFGNPVDAPSYLTTTGGTFLVLLESGTTLGVGTRQLHFVKPVLDETNTDILLADDSTTVTIDVDLTALTPVPLIADGDYFTLDWSGLTRNGLGNPIDLGHIDKAEVAWFADATLPDLEARFLDIELDADLLWQASIPSGTDVALDQLIGDGPFPGVTAEGIWLLSLGCTTCSNPAPVFFTVLTACEPE